MVLFPAEGEGTSYDDVICVAIVEGAALTTLVDDVILTLEVISILDDFMLTSISDVFRLTSLPVDGVCVGRLFVGLGTILV